MGVRCLPSPEALDAHASSGAGGATGTGGSPHVDAGTSVDRGQMAQDAGGDHTAGGDATTDRPAARDAGPPLTGVATTFQIDPAHSGGQPASRLRPPLKRRWSIAVGTGQALSYPLVTDAAVYFTTAGGGASKLYAVSAADGKTLWGPIDLGSNSFGSAADPAYDAGRVFTMNGTGLVSAFDAATGAPAWTRAVGDSIMVGAPVAVDGMVFVAPNGALSALDQNTGAVLFTGPYGGSPTSPAYTPAIAVLEYIEGSLTGFDPRTGKTTWHTTIGGSGGGGDTPVIYQGRIFAKDFWGTNRTLDLATGNTLGSFSASALPAFENGLGFFLANMTLEGHDLTGTVRWSFAGDGKLVSTPLAAGGAVYIGSQSGSLYALDEVTGNQLWTDTLGAPVAPANETYGLVPIAGLGASLDLLVVPAGSTMVAYGN